MSEIEQLRKENKSLQARIAVLEDVTEPNWRHPKAQGILGSKARSELVIMLAEGLIDNPDSEWSGTDYDYEHPLHDKIRALQARIAELEAALRIARDLTSPERSIDNSDYIYVTAVTALPRRNDG